MNDRFGFVVLIEPNREEHVTEYFRLREVWISLLKMISSFRRRSAYLGISIFVDFEEPVHNLS